VEHFAGEGAISHEPVSPWCVCPRA
jgi:hypothetical protein